MSARVTSCVWNDPSLKGNNLLVMLALAYYSKGNGESWPKISTLVNKTGLSVRAVQEALRRLEKIDALRVDFAHPGWHYTSHYLIVSSIQSR